MDFTESVLENIRTNYEEIFSAEKKVADYILEKPEHTVTINVSELAELSGASDATVIRLCKHLGYTGFYQMKLKLAHNLGQDKLLSGNILPTNPDSPDGVIQDIATNFINAKNKIDMDELKKCVDLILNCDTVHMVATGNSVPTSVHFAFRLGRVGVRNSSSFIPEQHFGHINLGSEKDIVIGISHSGSSIHVLQTFELAKKRNMTTIAITDLLRTPIANKADIALSTGVEYSSVYVFGAASNIFITALLDMLIYFVARAKNHVQNENETDVEVFLSESKI